MKTQRLTAISLFIIASVLGKNEVGAATLYVSQTSASPAPPYATWETAAHTIQEAIDAATDADTVLVGAGEYVQTNQVTVAKAIVLRSDTGASETVVTGRRTVRCLWITNPGAVVDGFTIADGGAWLNAGGGVFLVGGTVQNCTIRRCWASVAGSGVTMIGGILRDCIVTETVEGSHQVFCSSGGLITDCEISNNRHPSGGDGAGVYLVDSELRNSTITGNTGSKGGGVYAISSTIVGCTLNSNFAYDAGGGAYLEQCEVDRCVILGNSSGYFLAAAGRGGGIFGINSIIHNSFIAANNAQGGYDRIGGEGYAPAFGGGMYLRGGSLLNCTVTENGSTGWDPENPGRAGGIYVETGSARNSIIYFNSAPSNANWFDLAQGAFDHTCTTPDPGGVGNIVADPQFVDRLDGNYRLAPTSPCIDAGLNEPWMSGGGDLDGNPRIQNGTVDLGAWEGIAPNAATSNIRPTPLFRP